ncbi:MAG: B12-binding domain-containing radical SAM protein, partial [bacterium]
MKVLLISLGGQNIFAYGPRILSAYLKANQVETDLLLVPFVNPDRKRYFSPHWKFYDEDLVNKIIDPIVPHIREKGYDLVGISLTSNFYDHARMITSRIKNKMDIPVVWGGVHPTVRPDECLDYADYVIKGEGEEALLQLIEALGKNGGLEAVGNLVYKKDGEIKNNNLLPLLQDLDSLPMQDFDYSSHYLAYNYQINPITEELIYKVLPQGYGKDSYGYSTMATRGCPYGCSYCLNSTLRLTYRGKGKLLRKRSYQNVVEELAMIKSRVPRLSYFLFSDETFLMGKGLDWIKSFADLYKEKVGLPFSCCFAPEDVSGEALELLIEAGLFNVQMGIQSGSKRTLIEVYDRRDNTGNILKAAGILNKFQDHIMPLFDLILDNPYETDEDRKETIKFLLKLPRPFELQLFSLTWYPGAAITEKAIKDGIVKDVIKDVYRKHYQAYDRSNYYNLLLSMVPYFSADLIGDLLEKNDTFHYLAVRTFLKVWLSTRYVSGTWPYQLLKKVLVKYFKVEA